MWEQRPNTTAAPETCVWMLSCPLNNFVNLFNFNLFNAPTCLRRIRPMADTFELNWILQTQACRAAFRIRSSVYIWVQRNGRNVVTHVCKSVFLILIFDTLCSRWSTGTFFPASIRRQQQRENSLFKGWRSKLSSVMINVINEILSVCRTCLTLRRGFVFVCSSETMILFILFTCAKTYGFILYLFKNN